MNFSLPLSHLPLACVSCVLEDRRDVKDAFSGPAFTCTLSHVWAFFNVAKFRETPKQLPEQTVFKALSLRFQLPFPYQLDEENSATKQEPSYMAVGPTLMSAKTEMQIRSQMGSPFIENLKSPVSNKEGMDRGPGKCSWGPICKKRESWKGICKN